MGAKRQVLLGNYLIEWEWIRVMPTMIPMPGYDKAIIKERITGINIGNKREYNKYELKFPEVKKGNCFTETPQPTYSLQYISGMRN